MMSRNFLLAITCCAIFPCGASWGADADSRAAREHEMLRRTQEALRQSQTDNNELAQQKAQAEEKLRTATEQLDALRNASKSSEASLHSQLRTTTAAQEGMARQLEATQGQLAELRAQDAKDREQLKTREALLAQTQAELANAKTANASCETKNLKLYEYSQELAQRYQKKGVWASFTQKEPVFGLKRVDMENLLQEYQEKLAAQKIAPAPPAP